VISWKYDGTSNNGMPLEEENKKMLMLEDTIQKDIEKEGILRHAYSRTGNNLKELVYYIHDREEFIQMLNQSLSSHPRYAIDIDFYEDKKWEDFKKLLNKFSKVNNKQQ
jgi:hypothetical protein